MDKGSGQQVHIVENYSRLSEIHHSRLPYLVYGGSRTRYCMRLTLLYIYLVASTLQHNNLCPRHGLQLYTTRGDRGQKPLPAVAFALNLADIPCGVSHD